ncbi:MAG: hypothetical protein HY717_11205 [Planctomycetes bacterium]|nr:hypothetical protein [Planctomycetota bacterium]
MIRARDPTAMTPEERRAEVAGLLATGYLRSLAAGRISREKPSAVAERMAPCVQVVNSQENTQRKETA